MDKIIFHRNQPIIGKGSNPVRIKSNTFVRLEKISDETGMPMCDLATRLLNMVLDNVEVVD